MDNKYCGHVMFLEENADFSKPIKLFIKFNDNLYQLSSLRFDIKKCELIFSFPNNSKQPAKAYIDNKWKDVMHVDHTTFHADGKVHSKYKTKNFKWKMLDEHKYEKNIFDLVEDDGYLFIMFHSFYLRDISESNSDILSNNKILPKIKVDDLDKKNSFIWEISKPINFSLMFFVIGKNFNPNCFLDFTHNLMHPDTTPLVLMEPFNTERKDINIDLPPKSPSLLILLSEKTRSPLNNVDKNIFKSIDGYNLQVIVDSKVAVCSPKEIMKEFFENKIN